MQGVTYTELLRRAKAKADMEFSDFIDSEEWLDIINSSTRKLYNKLVEADQDFYTAARYIETNGTAKIYRLPADFYKLRGVDYEFNGRQRSMKRFSFRDRNNFENGENTIRYRVIGSQIHFEPTPSSQTITLWIVPTFEGFTGDENDDEEFDGINGWEEYVVLDAAIQALIKEESDTSQLMAERSIIEQEIEAMKGDRDFENAERVGDVTVQSIDRYEYGEIV